MRRAKPHELKTRAVPVLTAHLSEAELLKWLPVRFDDIDDPLATPEPSKGALIELETGAYVVVYYGKDSKQLTLEIPEMTSGSSELVASFLHEVPLPVSRVLWHRPDTKLPSGESVRAIADRMDAVGLALSDSLTDEEKTRLAKSAKRFVRITVADQSALDLVLPPTPRADQWGPGQQQQLGFDVGSILLVAVVSGGAIFLEKIAEKAAEDFWVALKGLIARVGARRRAVPKDSLQLQITLDLEDGMLVDLVLTCLHARFVDDKAWLSVIREWRSQLDQRLLVVRATRQPDRLSVGTRCRVTIHAVVRGGTTPVWFIGEPERCDQN